MTWLLHIKDKINLKCKGCKKMCCPPHTFPHKLPFTKPIADEPCHFHKAKWRMLHHRIFCSILKCPHYKKMMEEYKRSQISDLRF